MNRREIEEKIGYTFRNGALLERAFTHSSAHRSSGDYQNLEFLGDSVLGFIVSRRLYKLYPGADEGRLTKMRACIVSEKPLARAVTALGISHNLITGESERKTRIAEHDSIKCDLFEAVTAAIYLDGGLKAAEKFVLRELADDIADAKTAVGRADAKSRLNEYAMRKGLKITYAEEAREGAPHALCSCVPSRSEERNAARERAAANARRNSVPRKRLSSEFLKKTRNKPFSHPMFHSSAILRNPLVKRIFL